MEPPMTHWQKRTVESYARAVSNHLHKKSGPRFVLFLDPRGVGKSYMLDRMFDALRGTEGVKTVRIDGVAYADTLNGLCSRVLERLGVSHDSSRDAYNVFRHELMELWNAGKTTVLFIEDLHEVFASISDNDKLGLGRLRSAIQTDMTFSIFGTAPALFNDITSYDEPFYKFFETVNVRPFEAD